jgi:transposase-like protein
MPDESRRARIVSLYIEKHMTVRAIGAELGISGAAVWKHLKAAGVDAAQGEHVSLTCAHCQSPVDRVRSQSRHKRIFCNAACYFAARYNPAFVSSRNGLYIARRVVARHWKGLAPENVVHHHNGNEDDNDPRNLAVFANQSEHSKYHHGGLAQFLWDGRTADLSASR